MLREGERAPDLEGVDQHGRCHRLEELLAGGPLIVFFYPKDETPVCTREACHFRDGHERLGALGASVVGVGGGDAESHRRFAEALGLPYPLLLDEDGRIARAWKATWPLGGLRRRVTYVVDTDGTIAAAIWDELRAGRHLARAEEVLGRLAR